VGRRGQQNEVILPQELPGLHHTAVQGNRILPTCLLNYSQHCCRIFYQCYYVAIVTGCIIDSAHSSVCHVQVVDLKAKRSWKSKINADIHLKGVPNFSLKSQWSEFGLELALPSALYTRRTAA